MNETGSSCRRLSLLFIEDKSRKDTSEDCRVGSLTRFEFNGLETTITKISGKAVKKVA